MRDPNTTLGVAALTAIAVRARRKTAFEQPGTHMKEPRERYSAREKAKREAEAATWIEEVKARRRG